MSPYVFLLHIIVPGRFCYFGQMLVLALYTPIYERHFRTSPVILYATHPTHTTVYFAESGVGRKLVSIK